MVELRSASITSMIRHYVTRRVQVTGGRPYNEGYSDRPVEVQADDC